MAGGFTRNESFACGGTEEHRDANAPKVISSKNITELEVSVRSYDRWTGRIVPVVFSVRRESEGGPLILTRSGTKLETDESFLAKIQEIIDRYDLIKCNGLYIYTNGILPEFNNYILSAVYDSGEKLYFDIKDDPSASWCADMKKALCDELVRHGIEDMLPPIEDRKVARFDLKFNEWPYYYLYCTIRTQDDKDDERSIHFIKDVWNRETKTSESSVIIKIPEDFYARITELVEQTGLRDYSNGNTDFPSSFPGIGMGFMLGMNVSAQPAELIDKERTPFIGYCIEGESGKQFNTFIYGDDIPEGLKKAAGIVREYLEEVFSAQG